MCENNVVFGIDKKSLGVVFSYEVFKDDKTRIICESIKCNLLLSLKL